MSQLDTIEFKECLFETQSQALYRIVHKGLSQTIRLWSVPLSTADIERLQYLYAHEEALPNIPRLISLENRCAFVTNNCSGVPLPQIQSSASPRMVYEVLAQLLTILHQNHLTFDTVDGIFLTPEGTLSIAAPDISLVHPQIDGVWQLGWWALERLSSIDARLARQLVEEGKQSEYNALLQTALKRLELGLPNQQWTDSAIQSFQHVCAFEPYQRWTAATAQQMFEAYSEQAIGLSILQFCTQHHRLLETQKLVRGSKTGQVHPVQSWEPKEEAILDTQERSDPQDASSLLNIFDIFDIFDIFKDPNHQKKILSIGVATFVMLHFLTMTSMWVLSPEKTPAPLEEQSLVSIEITHDGIKQLTLNPNALSDKSLTPPDEIKLTRSKRDLSTTIPPGIYELRVKHNRKKYSALVRLEESSRLQCIHTTTKDVECTHNNRNLAWD